MSAGDICKCPRLGQLHKLSSGALFGTRGGVRVRPVPGGVCAAR